MKILTTVVTVACAALAPNAAPLSAEAGSDAPQAQTPRDKDAEFRTKFQQALEINAKDEITKLIRAYTEQSISYLIEQCTSISSGNERIEKELAALQEGWRSAYKSGYFEKIYKYYSLLNPQVAKDLDKFNKEYSACYKKYDDAKTKKDAGALDAAGTDLERLGKSFEEIGYQVYAAYCYYLAGECFDAFLRGSGADLNRAADLYGACVKACETWERNDAWALAVKSQFDALTKAGKGTAAGAAPGAAPSGPVAEPVKSATAVTSSLHFEAVPQFDAYLRPSYFLDDVAILWPVVFMREKGSSGQFQALDSKKIKLLRTASAALSVDLDGDGKGDQNVPPSGNHALVQIPIGEGVEKRDWAFVTEIGTDKESYQGVSVNFQPNDKQFQLYVMNAASMVGTLNNVPVRVFDDNMDGIYGSVAKEWQYPGLSEGSLQSDIDSIVVGAEKRARPWSQHVEVGGLWLDIEPQKGGLELKSTSVTFPTGKLKLDYKGEAPEFVILQGEGSYEKTLIDLLQNGGAEVNAPAGSYHLYFGLVRKGKKQQMMKALMLPGRRTPKWIVEPGKTTTVTLGAPYGFDFSTELKDGKAKVKGPSVTVVGSQFERYERLWNCVPRPELSWRKEGTKKASKPEKLGIVEDLTAEDDKGKPLHEYTDTFHPLDLSVEVKLKEGENAEYQLVEKKNKLFGPIESAWKK